MIVSYNSIVYFCASSVAVALVLFLLFNRPDAYASFYETVYLADDDPGARPKVGLCLSMPFSKENLESLNVPTQLASFLLFALSPFFPKESVIGDQVRNGAVPKSEPHVTRIAPLGLCLATRRYLGTLLRSSTRLG